MNSLIISARPPPPPHPNRSLADSLHSKTRTFLRAEKHSSRSADTEGLLASKTIHDLQLVSTDANCWLLTLKTKARRHENKCMKPSSKPLKLVANSTLFYISICLSIFHTANSSPNVLWSALVKLDLIDHKNFGFLSNGRVFNFVFCFVLFCFQCY